MTTSSDTLITFTAGRYEGDQMSWQEATGAPTTISLTLFRAIFDAVGDETIDTTGDIDPGVLLRIIGIGPRGTGDSTADLRVVCHRARSRGARVRFEIDEPVEIAGNGARCKPRCLDRADRPVAG